MLNVKWFLGMFISSTKIPLSATLYFLLLGIPFNDSVDWGLAIAEKANRS